MRVLSATCAFVFVVGCKGKDAEPEHGSATPPKVGDAGVAAAPVAADWKRCETALRQAPKVPSTRRVTSVIEACTPCGDWKPLLEWDTQQVDGGPTRVQIEQAMLACKAYCDPNAKQRFLGNLDAARGKGTRGPWRFLGELCGPAVSAVPDARFVSAPYFALDRIARAVATRPDLAPLLDGFDLPLPAIGSTGSGFALATSPATTPDAGPLALTVSAAEIRIAIVPRAKLGKDGVTVVTKGELYPGALVKSTKEVEAAITALGAKEPIAVFAPSGMAASRLVDVIAIAGRHDLHLAVVAEGAPAGWVLAGTIPVGFVATFPNDKTPPGARTLVLADNADALIKEAKTIPKLHDAQLTIALTPKATIAGVAKLVGALAFFDVKQVALVRAKP